MTGMAPMLSRLLFAGALFSAVLFQSECPAQSRDSGANPKAPVPPTLHPAPSPIQYFRRLLEASAAEREQLLLGKSPEQRRVLTNSVRSYLGLSPEDRELRLQAMELRYYLTPLIQLPATNRALGLQVVPESYRTTVQERLAYWDRLAPEVRQQMLDRGILVPILPTRSYPVRGYTSNQLAAVDDAARQWGSLPSAKRDEITDKVEKIVKVTPEERERILRPLPWSDAERGQIENSLEKFSKMKPAERQLVVNSFKKLADLSLEERRQFLRNAEAWQKMSPEDRQRWRYLVNHVPPLPPLPFGFLQPIPLLPKFSTNAIRPSSILTATN